MVFTSLVQQECNSGPVPKKQKTAKALGIEVPTSILLRADEVIE